MDTKPNNKALTALITAVLIGGLGNTLLASSPQDPWLFLSLRFLFAGLIALYWLPRTLKLPKRLMFASALEVASIITLVLSLSTISVSLATVIGATAPIATFIINNTTQHQPTRKTILIPITLGTLSTILIGSQQANSQSTIVGVILSITSVALGVTVNILNGWYGTEISALTRTALTNMLGMLVTIPILTINLITPTVTHPTWEMMIPAFLAAVLAGTIAKTLHLYALKTIPIPAVLQASTLSVVTAVITSWIFLNQQPNSIIWVGVALGVTSTITLAYMLKAKS